MTDGKMVEENEARLGKKQILHYQVTNSKCCYHVS